MVFETTISIVHHADSEEEAMSNMHSLAMILEGNVPQLRLLFRNIDEVVLGDWQTCTSTDPENHQGDTCPIHEGE